MTINLWKLVRPVVFQDQLEHWGHSLNGGIELQQHKQQQKQQ